jgi:hypothetical protein
MGDQHQRRDLRNDCDEIGQHRFARSIDPMDVLDDVHRRISPFEGGGGDDRGQAPAPRIWSDVGQRYLGVADAEQVVDEQQILRVGVRESGSNVCSGLVGAKTFDAGGGSHQPGDHAERDIGGVGSAVRGEHWHTAAGRTRHGFAHESALADSGRPDDSDHTSGATDGLLEQRGNGVEFPLATDECRVAAPTGLVLTNRQ